MSETPSDIAALVASVREAEEEMTPGPWVPDADDGNIDDGEAWIQPHGNCNTIARTGERFSHGDLNGIALLRNSAIPLCDAIEELQRELQEAAAKERSRIEAKILSQCRCDDAFKLRNRIDPDCQVHYLDIDP